MKITKQDKVFSQLVRERANWTCERCGKVFPEGYRQGLHCSHTYSRTKASTRLHQLNASAHCHGCHTFFGDNPVLFAEWIEDHLRKDKAQYLRHRAHQIVKKTKAYKEEEYKHLKKELARMLKLRSEGETGRIEFTAYDED